MKLSLVLHVGLLLISAVFELLELFGLSVQLLLVVLQLQLKVVVLGSLSCDLLVASLNFVLSSVVTFGKLQI